MTPHRIAELAADAPAVLIAGPTASGKSALALWLSAITGGPVVNADALQVYGHWRVLTARPGPQEEARRPHRLYGHVDRRTPYSVGRWLDEVAPLIQDRPVIVGGTGLYFGALTGGLARIPPVPGAVRAEADAMGLDALLADLDPATAAGIDTRNRARVQRAWEVRRATGRGLAEWHADPTPPLIQDRGVLKILIEADKAILTPRIERRLDQMIAGGALDEVAANLAGLDPSSPGDKAIGAAQLAAHLRGEIDLPAARDAAVVATRQYAKRQRTWFRARMAGWHVIQAAPS